MPTLATDISKNKQARANFLFDSRRTNIVLLRSNKKLTSGPLFINILPQKKAFYHNIHILAKKIRFSQTLSSKKKRVHFIGISCYYHILKTQL